MLGQQLGEYVVHRHIGRGGMGVVYEGEHATIGRKVAIKLIRENQANEPQTRGLLSEARAASAIRHHGIIDIFGFGQQPGVGQYLVMEYLEGRPLNEVLQERAPFPLNEAVTLLCEVLDALSAAHAVGVIHRDLKPSNIFVVRQSNGAEIIKVLDFGLAKRSTTPEGTTPQTHSNVIVGTPQYMAPEQALCEEVGPQTDLYAVGVIAFELLTGRRPFTGRSHMEIVAHHLKTPAPAPSSVVELPPAVDALILWLLAKDPRQRPASARAVANELRALLQPADSPSLSVARSARSSSIPLSSSASHHASTATLRPTPALPSPSAGAPPVPTVRRSRWKWGAAAGGLLLGLGAAMVVAGNSASQAPLPVQSASEALSTAPAQPPLQPEARAPTPESASRASPPGPGQPETPTRLPVETARRDSPLQQSSRRKAAPPTPPGASTNPSRQPPSPPQELARLPAATGTLHLLVKGAWVDVWVDGRKLGRVPPTHSYTLATGEHELELRNPALPPYQQRVVIPPGGTLSHTADFRAPALGFSP